MMGDLASALAYLCAKTRKGGRGDEAYLSFIAEIEQCLGRELDASERQAVAFGWNDRLGFNANEKKRLRSK